MLKTIFTHFWVILDQNNFLKKKVPKFSQKYHFFLIWIVGFRPKMADNRPKSSRLGPVFPKFWPKFFLSPNLKKFMILSRKVDPPPPKKKRLFFWGGGWVRQLYGTYPRYHLSWIQSTSLQNVFEKNLINFQFHSLFCCFFLDFSQYLIEANISRCFWFTPTLFQSKSGSFFILCHLFFIRFWYQT